jgi:hypothetical protein
VADGYNQQAINLVANELIRRGVRPEVAAGAVAGLMGESGPSLDPTSFNSKDPGGGSGGIGQWNRGRLIGGNGMLAFAAANGVPGLDVNNPQDAKKVPLATQAQYLGHELDTNYSGVLRGLQSVSTGHEGLTTWVNNYEDPADKAGAIAQRQQYIQPVAARLGAPATTAVAANAPAAAPVPGTTLNTSAPVGALGTAAGPPLPGFTQAQSSQFLQGASGLDKAMGGPGLTGQQGEGGEQEQMRPAQMAQGPPAHIPNPAQAAQTYGTVLNSIRQPLQWGSTPPGSQTPIYQSAGSAAPGTSLTSLQLAMLDNPTYRMMGMGGMGAMGASGNPYGGFGYV